MNLYDSLIHAYNIFSMVKISSVFLDIFDELMEGNGLVLGAQK